MKTNKTFTGIFLSAAIFFIVFILLSCNNKAADTRESRQPVNDATKQLQLFNSLVTLTNNGIPDEQLNDSLAFLVLPLDASCPSCRDKTIDSIARYATSLPEKHFIILSANGGRKKIGSFFREREHVLPVTNNRIFLDSIGQAGDFSLYDNNPAFFYAHSGKVYEQASSIPGTIKQDLYRFFR